MATLDKHLQKIQEIEPVTMALAGTTFGAVNILLMAIRTYKDYFTKAARQCSGLPPKEKAICMLRAKMYATNVELQTLKGNLNKCNKSRDPQKCRLKVENKIKSTLFKLKGIKQRYQQLKNQEYKS